MRGFGVSAAAAAAAFAAVLSVGGLAFSQTPAEGAGAKPAELSPEDQNAAPFPPGPHAALVKKVCTECHNGKIITDMRFTREDATRFYKNMIGDDVNSEQAQRIIAYLSTTLAP